MLALLLLLAVSPADRARDVAGRLAAARRAMREIHLPAGACLSTVPIEAYALSVAGANRLVNSTAWSWYAARAPPGWERFEALIQDGSDVAAWSRTLR